MSDATAPPRSNLNFFFTLDAILNSSSLSQAAASANLTQPAISMALKKARSHYGDEIVSYTNGRRELTALAVALRPQVRRLLTEARQVLDFSVDFDPATDERTIRLTMPDFVEVTFLPRILRAVRAVAPNIDLEVIPFDYWSAQRQFEKGIDFALLPTSLSDPGQGCLRLYDDTLSVMVSRSHPAVSIYDGLSLEEYRNGAHAALFDDLDLMKPQEGPVAGLLASRSIVIRTGIYSALPGLILDTDLIVTTSSRYAQHCSSIMDLTSTSLPIPSERVDIYLQWQRYRDREPIIRWFAALLAAEEDLGE